MGEFLVPMQDMGVKFKHLGVVAQPERLRNLVFKFLLFQNTPENHETWHGLMTWHEHAAVIFLAELGQALV